MRNRTSKNGKKEPPKPVKPSARKKINKSDASEKTESKDFEIENE